MKYSPLISARRDLSVRSGQGLAERMRGRGLKAGHTVFPTATHLCITIPGQPTAFDRAVYYVSRFLQRQN